MVTDLTSKLWDIVNSSSTYNFAENPLPVFFLLYANKCMVELDFNYQYDKESDKYYDFDLIINEKQCTTITDLFDSLQDKSIESLYDNFLLFDDFWFVLPHGRFYKEDHLSIVAFFMDKISWENSIYSNSKSTINFFPDLFTSWGDISYHHIYSPYFNLCCLSTDWDDYLIEEPDQKLVLISKVLLDAHGINPNIVIEKDPLLQNSLNKKKDCLLMSIPPVHKFYDLLHEIYECRDITALVAVPKSFCMDNKYLTMRRFLIDSKRIKMVIELPHDSVTNIDYVILGICSESQNINKTLFIDARENTDLDETGYFSYLHYSNEKYDWSLKQYRNVSFNKIEDNGYNLEPSSYTTMSDSLSGHQDIIKIGDVLETKVGNKVKSPYGKVLESIAFSNDIMSIFKKKDLSAQKVEDSYLAYSGKSIVLSLKQGNIHIFKWDSEDVFYTSPQNLVLKLTGNSSISIEYAIYALLNSPLLNEVGLTLSEGEVNSLWNDFSECQISILKEKTEQEKVISQLKSEYALLKRKELEAELQRLGIRQASSDMAHMLGHAFDTIGIALDDLKAEGLTNEAKRLVNVLNDNMDYIHRFVQTTGADLMDKKVPFSLEEREVNGTIKTVLKSWSNLSTAVTFKTEYHSSISDETTFKIDESYIKVLFDTLLDNAYRHGFGKNPKPENKVQITSTGVRMDDKDYVLLKIANNGKPFPADFTLQKFISRGEFCGESGRTGLGGNHIHSIVKRHKGFLYITQDDEWNCIFEILLPIEYQNEIESKNNRDYEHIRECL